MSDLKIVIDTETDALVVAPSGQTLRIRLEEVDPNTNLPRATVSFYDPPTAFRISRANRVYLAPTKVGRKW